MDLNELKTKMEAQGELPEQTSEGALTVCEMELGNTQKLVFSLSEYRGKLYFDIRTWYQDESGVWKPTKKGIRTHMDRLDEFLEGVQVFRLARDLSS